MEGASLPTEIVLGLFLKLPSARAVTALSFTECFITRTFRRFEYDPAVVASPEVAPKQPRSDRIGRQPIHEPDRGDDKMKV